MPESILLGCRVLFDKPRQLLIMAFSVAIGVCIMFVEIALLDGILNAQTRIADLAQGEFIAMSSMRIDLHRWNTIDLVRLKQIAAVPGVDKVMPVYEFHVGLRNPVDNRVRRIILFAFAPEDLPLAIGKSQVVAAMLHPPRGLLFDRQSRPIYGPIRPGMEVEIDGTPFPVKGFVDIGPDIVNDGNVVVSAPDWLARMPDAQPIMGVVRLKPGADREKTRAWILSRLDDSVVVLTPREAHEREVSSILSMAPVGLLFLVGALAGFVIGAVNSYQVLYTLVVDRLPQLATLKAMGFSDHFLLIVVMAQAAVLAGVGFVIGVVLASAADFYIAWLTKLPVIIGLRSLTLVTPATIGMCFFAGWIVTRRVAAVDPAALY